MIKAWAELFEDVSRRQFLEMFLLALVILVSTAIGFFSAGYGSGVQDVRQEFEAENNSVVYFQGEDLERSFAVYLSEKDVSLVCSFDSGVEKRLGNFTWEYPDQNCGFRQGSVVSDWDDPSFENQLNNKRE